MTVMRLYRLLQVFMSAVNDIVQALHNEKINAVDAQAAVTSLVNKLLADIS